MIRRTSVAALSVVLVLAMAMPAGATTKKRHHHSHHRGDVVETVLAISGAASDAPSRSWPRLPAWTC